MASIGTVQLTLVETSANAKFRVNYNALGNVQDVQQHRTYIETIELIGVDEGAGEDGPNEPIPGGRVVSLLTFQSATTARSRPIEVPVSAIDEDKFGPLPIPLRDEIRARVTLALAGPGPVSRNSNVVTRGGLPLPTTVPA